MDIMSIEHLNHLNDQLKLVNLTLCKLATGYGRHWRQSFTNTEHAHASLFAEKAMLEAKIDTLKEFLES